MSVAAGFRDRPAVTAPLNLTASGVRFGLPPKAERHAATPVASGVPSGFRHESARYAPVGPRPYDEPDWFPAWFDEFVPPTGRAGYAPQELAALLDLGKDVIYRAIKDGRLEAIKVSNKGYLIPRPAVRLYLVERNTLNEEGAREADLRRAAG